MPHQELHYVHRTGWLRAAVLGANDGLISTASLVVGVAAASSGRAEVLTAAFAGWAAGAMAMAAGEFVSVSSQADLEAADLERERRALDEEPRAELDELAKIYEDRGLDPELSQKVAEQLMARDALSAHARDELGLAGSVAAKPIQAAVASALSFSTGAALPTVAALVSPRETLIAAVAAATLVFLAGLGALGAWLGGAGVIRPAIRVGFWGAIAIAVTAGIGALVGKAL
ncbi:MAG TPA: VIT family protein [Roseiarcus sp.]|nr:VIT family protein [Roseiarcus sp.]